MKKGDSTYVAALAHPTVAGIEGVHAEKRDAEGEREGTEERQSESSLDPKTLSWPTKGKGKA